MAMVTMSEAALEALIGAVHGALWASEIVTATESDEQLREAWVAVRDLLLEANRLASDTVAKSREVTP